MKQVGRRSLYFAIGVLPASLGLFFVLALKMYVLWPGALAGTAGLIWAAASTYPMGQRAFGRVALLLLLGLLTAAPFAALAVYLAAGDLSQIGVSGFFSQGKSGLAPWLLVLLGPAGCALHALWRGRRAPNNSFKPKPLRGSA
jgi:hypothetical protein